MKTCKECGVTKQSSEFYGIQNDCKECFKRRQREYYSQTKNERKEYEVHRQRYNFDRMFRSRYSAMKSRVEGRAIKHHPVEGKELLSLGEFLAWCREERNMKVFKKLHHVWSESGFSRKFAPSIDRIDDSIGYSYDNLQWLSLSENVKKDIDIERLRKNKRDPKTGRFV